MVSTGRSSHAKALLGGEAFDKIRHSKVLVVGAGGIGCELRKWYNRTKSISVVYNRSVSVKNLVLVGFGNIEIVGARLPPR
jgi:ubiquitin-like 1-activating enzyme E1 B